MADIPISHMPSGRPTDDQYVAAIDLTRPTGAQNIKLRVADLINQGQVGGSMSTIYTQHDGITGLSTGPNGTVSAQIYTPTAPTADVMVLSLELKAATLAAPTYNFQLYAGDPAHGGVLVYDYHQTTGTFLGLDGIGDFFLPSPPIPKYIPFALGSTNAIYLTIINQTADNMQIFPQIVVEEFPASGIILPGYTPPPPYIGPLMDVVQVGPTRQFAEPQYAMAAIADGGTMEVDPGNYYLPFGATNDPSLSAHPNFGPNPNSPTGAARFATGITVKGSGTYGDHATVFNGRGGYGLNPLHPFRLTTGKGFFLTQTNVNVSGVRFVRCGGDDQYSDGEAGVYVDADLQINGTFVATVVNIDYCAFDQCENGVFTSGWYNNAGDVWPHGGGSTNNVTLNIDHCDFGYLAPNGGSGDGFASDMYLECPKINLTNSNFYGDLSPLPWRNVQEITTDRGVAGMTTTSGNCLKMRGVQDATIDNCWVRNQSGKWIDLPWGGNVAVSNSTFSSLGGVTSLVLGYNTEAGPGMPLQPMENLVFTRCTLYCSRFNEVMWNNTGPTVQNGNTIGTPEFIFDFQECTFNFTNPSANWVPNRDNSGFGAHQEVAPNLLLTSTVGGPIVPPPAAPPPASMSNQPGATGIPVPLNR